MLTCFLRAVCGTLLLGFGRNCNSWQVLRGQSPKSRLQQEPGFSEQQQPPSSESEDGDGWGVGADDWNVDESTQSGGGGSGWDDFSELEKALDQHEARAEDPQAKGKGKGKKDLAKGKEYETPRVAYLQDERFVQSSFAAHYLCFEIEPDPVAYKKTMSKHERGEKRLCSFSRLFNENA